MTSHTCWIAGLIALALGIAAGCSSELTTPSRHTAESVEAPSAARSERLIDVPEIRLARHLSAFIGSDVRPGEIRFPRMRQLYSWYAAPEFMLQAAGTGGTFLYAEIVDASFPASTLMFDVPPSSRPFYGGAKFVVVVNERWNHESGWNPGRYCPPGEECRSFPVLTREILDFVPEIHPDPDWPYAYLHCSHLLCLAKLSSEPKPDECDPFLNPCPPLLMTDIQAEYTKLQSVGPATVVTRIAVQLDGALGLPSDTGGSIADDIGG